MTTPVGIEHIWSNLFKTLNKYLVQLYWTSDNVQTHAPNHHKILVQVNGLETHWRLSKESTLGNTWLVDNSEECVREVWRCCGVGGGVVD